MKEGGWDLVRWNKHKFSASYNFTDSTFIFGSRGKKSGPSLLCFYRILLPISSFDVARDILFRRKDGNHLSQ